MDIWSGSADTWEQDAINVYRVRIEAFYGEEPQVSGCYIDVMALTKFHIDLHMVGAREDRDVA
jgi:hypothetical protein